MRLNEIRSQIDRRPFAPFRICMSDGSEYLITNPNLVFLTKSSVIVGILGEDDEEIPEATTYCDTMHITRVEALGG